MIDLLNQIMNNPPTLAEFLFFAVPLVCLSLAGVVACIEKIPLETVMKTIGIGIFIGVVVSESLFVFV